MRDVKDLNKKSDQEAKRLKIYLAAAYGVTFLMGLLMWYGSSRHYDLSTFPNAQMYYPAAGVMLGVLFTQKGDALVPKVFFIFLSCVTVILAAAVSLWTLVQQVLIIGASIACWILLLLTKKEKRRAYGLCWNKSAASWFCIVLFVGVYLFRTVLVVLWSGQISAFGMIAKNPNTWLMLAACGAFGICRLIYFTIHKTVNC